MTPTPNPTVPLALIQARLHSDPWLTNRTIQVIFLDGTEVILSSEARVVTYTNKESVRRTFSLSEIMHEPRHDSKWGGGVEGVCRSVHCSCNN